MNITKELRKNFETFKVGHLPEQFCQCQLEKIVIFIEKIIEKKKRR